METYARAYQVRSAERGGEMYEQYCASCHGFNASGGMCPPLDEYSGLHGGSRGPGIAWRMEELGLDRTAAKRRATRARATQGWKGEPEVEGEPEEDARPLRLVGV